ncbi:cysteinyl-tRNA synthetase, partial [Candidatus Magnetoovum chiemensis]
HYRSPIEFSYDQLKTTEASIDRFYTTLLRVDDYYNEGLQSSKKRPADNSLERLLTVYIQRFIEAMDDDFNSAAAVGLIFELVRELNRFLDMKPVKDAGLEIVKRSMELLNETGSVFNIFSNTPAQWNKSLMITKKIALEESQIIELIEKRDAARKNKDWSAADSIRKELDAKSKG